MVEHGAICSSAWTSPVNVKRPPHVRGVTPVSRPKRIALAAGIIVLLTLVAAGIWLVRSLGHVPAFYSEALAVNATELDQSNREMLRRTAKLSNDFKRFGKWEALFTDRQINGWLAVDVPKNHPELLPADVLQPRVRIHPDELLAGARIERNVSAVVSVELAVHLSGPGTVAVRVHRIRVGDVPWALDRVVDQVIAAAQDWGLHVEQTQSDGEPVLLVTLPPDLNGRQIMLERLELREGEVYLSGQTKPAPHQ
jgi:hypothetical protein